MTCTQNCQQGRSCTCVDLVARLRDHVPYYEIEGEAADEIERLTAELAECKKLLKRLWIACPTALTCRDFHHTPNERHGYRAAMELALEALHSVDCGTAGTPVSEAITALKEALNAR